MKCPNSDGELIVHTTQGENNLTISYSTCPVCLGYWIEPFAANFIKAPSNETVSPNALPTSPPKCPVCMKNLLRATGENIPANVIVYTCPEGHGYFFPAGQLAAFKKAQAAKITYHKLWHLPLPRVGSVLLAGFLVLVLAGGLIAGLLSIGSRQTVSSQAQGLFSSQRSYVAPTLHAVLFTAQTPYDARLTLHIPAFNNFEKKADSISHRTHTLTVTNIPPATYTYYYTITIGREDIQSETYTFVMPQ